MNCVGCEKCRIWSKLNILGLSTGLKLAASRSIGNTNNVINGLKRNEIIAFVNTINSFSEAVNYINTLSFIPVGLQGEDNLVDIVEQDESSGEIGQGIQQVGEENRNEKNNQKNNQKKKVEKNTDLSKGQKIFVIFIGIIALGIIIWRQMVQPSDTFGQLDRMNPVGGKNDKNGPKKSIRAIPTQQLERLKRDQQEQLNNATGLLVNKLDSGNNNNNNSNVIGNGGKIKNKKMD
jgi:hypothetical protein